MNIEVLSEELRDMSTCHLVSGRPLRKYLLFGEVTKPEIPSLYRVSQEKWTELRESVPYVKT